LRRQSARGHHDRGRPDRPASQDRDRGDGAPSRLIAGLIFCPRISRGFGGWPPILRRPLDLRRAIGHTSPYGTEVRPMYFLKRLLTWWNSQTIGTQLFTARKGRKVGEDDQGNAYYQTADGKRRWVIFKGEMEASRVPPDWHGWLHHTWDEPPTKAPLPHK